MNNLTRVKLIIGLIILAGALGTISARWRSTERPRDCRTVTITTPNNNQIIAEVADDALERATGLSKRSYMAPHHGMLFDFPTAGIYPFWMKNTHIPLDIIWIKDHTVVEIASLEPASEDTIPQHVPANDANSVLELNRGEANRLNIRPGTILTWTDCWK